jgi:SAM-dependent methyltransferase
MISDIHPETFSELDLSDIQNRYTQRFEQHGYSPLTLGWNKGRQAIRFQKLTSEYIFSGKHVLDIGCGFGDLNQILQKKTDCYSYTGLDLVEALLDAGRELYPQEHIHFLQQNILDYEPSQKFDFAIASGVFNFKLRNNSNYQFIEETIQKTLRICNDGLAFDFLSDKVDFELGHTFHSSPEKILSIAYKYSKNVVLRNDYMPFEFSLFIFKDDRFDAQDCVFSRYKNLTNTNQREE